MLAKLGCDYTVVENGQIALDAILQGEHFDLMLLDQFMPVLDGPGTVRAIRGLSGPVGKMPIISMTSSNLQEDEASCLAAGMDGFLSRPVSFKSQAEMLIAHTFSTQRVSS
jgi:CheY-like chemotaxis protein